MEQVALFVVCTCITLTIEITFLERFFKDKNII
jgi:hypothetical protein